MFSPPSSAGNGPLTNALLSLNSRNSRSNSASNQHASNRGFGAFLQNVNTANRKSLSLNVKPVCIAVKGLDPERARLPSNYVSYASTHLIRAIRQILSSSSSQTLCPTSSLSYESLYSLANALVDHGPSLQDLYDRIKIEMERAVGEMAASLESLGASELSHKNAVTWLNHLDSVWQAWYSRIALVRSILLPLDRELAVRNSDLLSIYDLALDIFGDRIVANHDLAKLALDRMVMAINAERVGLIQYRKVHTSLVEMYVKLSAHDRLETALRDATSQFYQHEAKQKIASVSTADYLAYADDRIRQEIERNEWALATVQAREASIQAARQELISKPIDLILSGVPSLIDDDRLADLSNLYLLLKSVDQLTLLRKEFGEYIKRSGEAIVLDKCRDQDMIERLLVYKAKMDRIVMDAFAKQSEFASTQKDSFEVFVNKRENKPAELIAKFLDVKLRSGNKTMTDEALEKVLDEALTLFRFTRDKDMFEGFYKRHFAKRLLLNRSASSDAERSMLLKLKEECGPDFTAKLETMIKDIDITKDLMEEYEQATAKARKESTEAKGFHLGVNVLTQAHWPTYPQINVILPSSMSLVAEDFAAFYQARNSGRRLHWQHSLGTVSIIARFPKAGVKELNVSTFQAIVLLLFNPLEAGEKLSYSDIKSQAGLDENELKTTLQSLACGQIPTRVLRKIPQGKQVDDTDEFTFNENFDNPRHRVRINQIQMKETVEEQKSTEQRVFLDRELILQAAAVRVLKARKTIKHGELVTEVVDQIKSRFTVDVSEIKKVLEILIDKDYMERVEGERGVYRYLA